MSTDSTILPHVSHPTKPVDVEAIESELARLWKSPDPAGEGRATVTRACMSNLLIFCSSQDLANAMPEEIDDIVRIHPCRVILLLGEVDVPGDTIEAYVSAHCHLTSDRGQICSEHITVNATGDAVRRLPSTARSLVLGDLPTSLWWASHVTPARGSGLFDELEAMADQVVYSSLNWADPIREVAETARWASDPRERRATIADLAWRRLRPWRSLIAASLDPATVPGALDGLATVTIDHGSHSLPQAWLLAGWLASRLGWRVAGPPKRRDHQETWRFVSSHGPIELRVRAVADGDPEVHRLCVGWKAMENDVTMSFASTAPGRLEVSSEGLGAQPRVLAAPHQSRAVLVGRQIQELAADPVFLAALDVARSMAETR
jgi:glucose-6-phosphate dehydrogenase assembly protein OpcA